ESLVVGLPSAVPFVISAMHVVMMLIGFASLILNTIRAQGVDERRRMVILLTGSVVGLVPLLAVGVLAYSIGLAEVPLWAIGVAISASVCFPVSFIYVVVRHRVLGIRVILRRGLQYALVSRGFLVIEALVLVALFIITARSAFGRVIPEEGTIGLMIAAAVGLALFLGLRSVNRRIMPIIDRRFFREAYDTERVLAGLSTQVRCCAGRPRELLEVLAGTVGDALSVDIVAIYLAAPVNPIWCGAAASRGQTGGFGSCIVRTHPQAQLDSPNTSRLDLPPNAPFSSVLTRVDPERPEIVELYAGHPELLRRSGGERERVAEVQRHQHQVVEQLNLRLVVPLTTSDQVIGFIALGEKLSEEAYSGRDKDLLLGVAGQAAVAIDYAQMIVDVAESERLQHEIHLAGGVLGSLLPSEPPTIEGFDVKHVILPAQEVAGDFLQYFPAPDGGVSLVVGDVAGKGLRAAMVVTMALGGLEAIVQETRDPGAVLSRLNDLLMHRLGREGFVTCIFAHLDPRNGRLALANAGHPYPMLRDSKTSVWYELTGEGPRFPLGVRRGVGYQTVETTLAESADMVIMSDGVIEAPDSDGNQLGFDGVAQLLSEFSGGQGEVIQYLLDGVHEHMGDGRQQDDISLISLSRSSE
ncbi:MAG: SpoIIE family protein phosphatase, partial [bacterium]|nr:SpoIIE family protein phosphatase [bacterium]